MQTEQIQINTNASNTKAVWTMEMKIRLMEMEEQARRSGRGYMKKMKEMWDREFEEHINMSAQCLRDNVERFKKDPALKNLMLTKKETNQEHNEVNAEVEENMQENIEYEITDKRTVQDEGTQENQDDENTQQPTMELNEKDKKLEEIFELKLATLTKSTRSKLDDREKLSKVKIGKELKACANRVLANHIKGDEGVPEITDLVYAMGKTIEETLEIEQKKKGITGKENHRIRKLKKKIKKLRQGIARMGNEIFRRKTRRKAIDKEKKILGQPTE